MSNIAASQEPRVSKPGPVIADPSNRAAPATSSHRAAAAAAEAERRIQNATIAAQRAAERSPVITPPPETPIISATTTTSNKQPLSSSPEIEDNENRLDNLRDNLARRSTTGSKKRAHVVNGQSYY